MFSEIQKVATIFSKKIENTKKVETFVSFMIAHDNARNTNTLHRTTQISQQLQQ